MPTLACRSSGSESNAVRAAVMDGPLFFVTVPIASMSVSTAAIFSRFSSSRAASSAACFFFSASAASSASSRVRRSGEYISFCRTVKPLYAVRAALMASSLSSVTGSAIRSTNASASRTASRSAMSSASFFSAVSRITRLSLISSCSVGMTAS